MIKAAISEGNLYYKRGQEHIIDCNTRMEIWQRKRQTWRGVKLAYSFVTSASFAEIKEHRERQVIEASEKELKRQRTAMRKEA